MSILIEAVILAGFVCLFFTLIQVTSIAVDLSRLIIEIKKIMNKK